MRDERGLTTEDYMHAVTVGERTPHRAPVELEEYLPALEEAGYVLTIREPEWFEHRLLKTPERDVHVHVFSAGCEEVERMLAFRDHLRANDDDRMLYERTKRELAAQTWEHVQHYADSKTEVVEQIMQRVRSS